MGSVDEARLVPEPPGQFEEAAEGLPFVTSMGLSAQPIEVQVVALAPQQERQAGRP